MNTTGPFGKPWRPIASDTIDAWLDQQIEGTENLVGHLRSYRRETSEAKARLDALKEVRQKMRELWGR